MKVKKMIVSIVMALALIVPVAAPEAVTNTTSVVQAKTYKSKTIKAVRKKFNKLKYGMKYSKAKKILGGKPTEIKDLETTLDGSSTMGKYIWYFDCSTKTKLITVQVELYIIAGRVSSRTFSETYL